VRSALWKTRQLACSIGPERNQRRISHKDFALKDLSLILHAVQKCTYCINTVYIFLLCRLKINHKELTTQLLFLILLA
jgi:hypothetical protein